MILPPTLFVKRRFSVITNIPKSTVQKELVQMFDL